METEEQLFRLGNIIDRNRHFDNLMANEDFLKWKSENVEPYLQSILDSITSVDRSKEGWEKKVTDAVVAYQEGRKMYETMFLLASRVSQDARKQLSEAQAQPPS